jgi:hypothetical protein
VLCKSEFALQKKNNQGVHVFGSSDGPNRVHKIAGFRRAVSVGTVSYEQIAGLKMKRDVIYCFDLELPSDFLPFSNGFPFYSFV